MPQSSAPDPRERAQRQRVFWGQFVQGLALGTLASTLAWIPGWTLFGGLDGSFTFLLPELKIVIAIVCLSKKGWRGYGGGILLSIPIGFLIFFGSCAAHLTP